MILVMDRFPPPHDRYLVKREDYFFQACPCYGMHNPWWVQRLADSLGNFKEAEPIPILLTDQWIKVSEVKI